MRKYRCVSFFTLLLPVILLLGCIWLFEESINEASSINTKEGVQLNHADEVDKLLKLFRKSILNKHSASIFEISEEQIESLQGFLRRADNRLAGDAQFEKNNGVIRMSLAISAFGKSRFINTEVWLNSGLGIPINKVKIGNISIPSWLFNVFVKQGLNFYTRSNFGTVLYDSMNSITIEQNNIVVSLNPLKDLLDELSLIDRGKKTPEKRMKEQYTVLFLRQLEWYENQRGTHVRSLNDYIQYIFSFAQQQQQSDTVIVNEAAILSLAIFAGDYRIGALVGSDIHINPNKPSAPNHLPTLANREDLSKHFIISAALERVSRQQISAAVGEFKELMDRTKGGSGFSFVDLAADKAGVRFAVELSNPKKALNLQRRIANGIEETSYFPNIESLKEGITKPEFTQLFNSVDSESYRREIDKVNQRITDLSLYND